MYPHTVRPSWGRAKNCAPHDGRMILVAFRGPIPVSVKHAGMGSCPGFGLVTLSGDGGSTGQLTHVFRTFLPDATGTRNLSDIHAAVVRIK